ncbi:hypothetical protein OG948_57315 (plasmid) [Embleya sp. NBC_00888]|uniref:hypothetical protein n=1 Tax=Embleya sp. NBC_00888 TaxID=2975960 RepID=UPI002F90CC25|nr:hypothetical protein OG948_57315 [Embleya sp. NBC_00888]
MTTRAVGRRDAVGGMRASGAGAGGRGVVVASSLVLLWAATGVLMLVLPLGAMASDPCGSAADGLICMARGRALCWQIPWFGGPVLAVVGTVAILARVRAVRCGAVLAWAVGLVAMVVAVGEIANSYRPR